MKQKLMDTACRLWQEKGCDAVSVTQISSACGVTKGSFYYYAEYLVAAATGMMLYRISLKKDFDIDTFRHKTIRLLLSAA